MQPREAYDHPGPLGRAMSLPSRGLWLHHSAYEPLGNTRERIRRVAQVGIDRFGRSSYSFALDPREPQTWWEMQGHHVGVHTAKQNSTSHGLVVLGNFEKDRPSDELVSSIAGLVRFGFEQHWWSSPTLLGGHRDNPHSSTACPGKYLYAQIDRINRIAKEMTVPEQTEPSSWAKGAWDWAKANGLANDNTLPLDPVNKQEFFALLNRYHNNVAPKAGQTSSVPAHSHRLTINTEVK